jgi:dihydrofolate reductase
LPRPDGSVDFTLTSAWLKLCRFRRSAFEVASLKHQPGRELQLHGSGTLARTLMDLELIDEYRLWIFPVVVGAGRRLFTDGALPAALKLVDTKTTGTGVVIHSYQPAGKPTYGSF